MGFWDFFRKKEEQEVENERISQDELENWLKNKKLEIEKQELDFSDKVKDRNSQFISKLQEEISILKEIDIEKIKSEDKIKLIVNENLENYINYLERLIKKLKDVDNDVDIVENIKSIFFDFQKTSHMSYEKATFLIGKELGDVRDNIGKFLEDNENMLKDNQIVINESKIIKEIENDVKKLKEIKKLNEDNIKNIHEHDGKIIDLKNKIKKKDKETEILKKSEKFIMEIKNREKLEEKEQELENHILKLREIIDFKELSSFYHSFEKEKNIINTYKENFIQVFHKTSGEDIISLLKEAKLNNENIDDKVKEIEEKKKEINSIVIGETGVENLETEIKKLKSEIEIINSEKFVKEKKSEKFNVNQSETINSVREKLGNVNVNLIE
tara:strand:+ start:984 stop:2138 length:1155 start_codon:yes stop_codon:yes gene_type:complete